MNKRRPTRKIWLPATIVIIALLGLGSGLLLLDNHADAPKVVQSATKQPVKPAAEPAPAPAPAFNKALYSTTDPASLWVVVNKQHPFTPVDYAPGDIVTAYGHQVSSRIVPDLTALITAAESDGAHITVVSSYRSYAYQINLYNSYVASDGQAKADTYSARAGFSEHQTGLAVDFGNSAGTCTVEDCFADTTEGKWLAANAYKYGFLLRYTAEKQSVTGYQAEAWHYRYVGRELTAEMHTQGITTLEEFFGVSGGDYSN